MRLCVRVYVHLCIHVCACVCIKNDNTLFERVLSLVGLRYLTACDVHNWRI